MSRKTHRAGAFATALMLIVTLFAANGSGAWAQSDGSIALNAPLLTEATDTTDPLPHFFSEAMVQPLPEEGSEVLMAEADTLHELVAAFAPDDQQMSGDLQCLAQAIYFEARGEELSGQLAVARVIVNRSRSPLFPNDYCSIVKQPAQFSFVRKGRIPSVPKHTRAWRRATAIAQIAHEELWESEAQDALFFHADYVRPSWARTKLARATIDSHIFYR